MTKQYITEIGAFSLGRIIGATNAVFGFIFGTIMGLISLGSGTTGGLLGLGAIITLPIMYGIIGFISGLLTAFVFNIITVFVGGLEIEIE